MNKDKDIRNFFQSSGKKEPVKEIITPVMVKESKPKEERKEEEIITKKKGRKRKAHEMDKEAGNDIIEGNSAIPDQIQQEPVTKKKKTKSKGKNDTSGDVVIQNPFPEEEKEEKVLIDNNSNLNEPNPVLNTGKKTTNSNINSGNNLYTFGKNNKKIIDDEMDIDFEVMKPETHVDNDTHISNSSNQVMNNKQTTLNLSSLQSINKSQNQNVIKEAVISNQKNKAVRVKIDANSFFKSAGTNQPNVDPLPSNEMNCGSVEQIENKINIVSSCISEQLNVNVNNEDVRMECDEKAEETNKIENINHQSHQSNMSNQEQPVDNFDDMMDDLDLESLANDMFGSNVKKAEQIKKETISTIKPNPVSSHNSSSAQSHNIKTQTLLNQTKSQVSSSTSSNQTNTNNILNNRTIKNEPSLVKSETAMKTEAPSSIQITKEIPNNSNINHTNSQLADSYKIKSQIPSLADSNRPLQNKNSTNRFNELWTVKYSPSNVDSIIGNLPAVKKLQKWLADWDDVHLRGMKKDLDFSSSTRGKSKIENLNAKACIISGSPGIGKTTTVRLIASALGFKTFELNASDQRNKQIIMSKVGYLMDNTTISRSHLVQKNLIVMDEVDGMAGHEDKGGISALIDIVKKTRVPIVCICNDIGASKLRSLINHCLDLKFAKPEKSLVIRRLKEICNGERLPIDITSLETLYDSSGGDIRQCLNFLEMQARKGTQSDSKLNNNINTNTNANMNMNMNSNQSFKESLMKSAKDGDLMLNAFDACKKMLNKHEYKQCSYRSKMDLFFIDFDLIPNLIQENYLYAFGSNRSILDLKRLNSCAENISLGDVIDRRIRTENEWNLLPNRGLCSAVAPAFYSNGVVGYVKFPELFGKVSKMRKLARQSKELKCLFPSQSMKTIKDEIAPIVFSKIVNSLVEFGKEGIDKVINILNEFRFNLSLFKENLFDLQTSEAMLSKYDKMNTAIKSALTRKLNEEFRTSLVRKKKKEKDASGKRDEEGNLVEEEDSGESDGEEYDVQTKEAKKPTNKKTSMKK